MRYKEHNHKLFVYYRWTKMEVFDLYKRLQAHGCLFYKTAKTLCQKFHLAYISVHNKYLENKLQIHLKGIE